MITSRRGKLYFDITDVLEFARFNATLSGIQRVSLMTINKLLELYGNDLVYLIAYHPVKKKIEFYDASILFNINYNQVNFCNIFELESYRNLDLAEYISHKYKKKDLSKYHYYRLLILNKISRGKTFESRNIKKSNKIRTNEIKNLLKVEGPKAGDTIFIPGATWGFKEYIEYLNKCSKSNVEIVQFVHDLIPLIVPEHVVDDVPEQFSSWLRAMATVSNRFIVNSISTGEDLKRFLETFKFPEKSISIVPLAHEFYRDNEFNEAYDNRQRMHEKLYTLADNYEIEGIIHARVLSAARLPFVLCVGTIESRKNVWGLARAWLLLAEELKEDMPRLVFAGKHGWLKEDFDDLLKGTGNVGGLIRIVERPSDIELEFLYRKCQFSVCLSYYEGWGLPVGESLWFDKPVLASSTSSIPEVGGNFVDYVHPNSLKDIKDGLKRMIVDKQHIFERTKEIAKMKKRTWSDVASDMAIALGID